MFEVGGEPRNAIKLGALPPNPRRIGRLRRMVTLLVAVPVVLAACAPSRSAGLEDSSVGPAPSAPKNVVVINSGNPPGMDTRFVVTTNNAARIVQPLYAGQLIFSDAVGETRAALVEAVPTIANGLWKVNSDNTMETRLTLRQGAKWHDGTPLTTKDLIFNDEVFQDRTLPQIPIAARQHISRMEAVDDRTLVIHWRQPFILADVFSPDMMPAHLLEATFKEDRQAVTTHPWLSGEYVGTGPFRLKEFVPASHMDLIAFDSYVLGRPKIDTLQVKFIPDSATMLTNIISGAGDLSTGTGPNATQAQQLKSIGWNGQISANIQSSYVHLFSQHIDAFNPIAVDKRFKKGLMFALDRQTLVDTLQYGYGGIAEIPWPPGDPDFKDYVAKVERYPYDPQRAAAMFQALGYAKGPDGFLRSNTTGSRLEPVEFRTTGEQSFQVAILAAMSDMFKQAGLDINQVVIPQERTADRQYRVAFPGLEVLQFGTGASTMLNQGAMTTSKLPTAANGYTTGNYPRYSNPEWDGLIDKFAITIVPTQRKQVITEMMVHISDNLQDMSIIWGVSVQFASKRLTVPELNPMWTAEQWDIRS